MLAVLIAIAASMLRRVIGPWRADKEPAATADGGVSPYFLPVIGLCVGSGAPEADWVKSFAAFAGGRREFSVRGGRVDVITGDFAVELDFIERWHEGLGQALHYGSATQKRPALALIFRDDRWPPDARSAQLLGEIDKVCLEQRVKLVLLRSSCR
jgi:hypothetical protein